MYCYICEMTDKYCLCPKISFSEVIPTKLLIYLSWDTFFLGSYCWEMSDCPVRPCHWVSEQLEMNMDVYILFSPTLSFTFASANLSLEGVFLVQGGIECIFFLCSNLHCLVSMYSWLLKLSIGSCEPSELRDCYNNTVFGFQKLF